MAYTGGVYTKPIKNNAQQLAQFYLQGAMQVAQIKEQVQKSRSEELNQLAEAASEIVATGEADVDKLIMGGASLLKNFIYEGHELNKADLISRSQATARANNALSQANQLAQLSKHQQESYQEIQDGIAKGDLSAYSAAIKNRFWFKDKNFVPKKFKTADGEIVSRNESFQYFMDQNNNLTVSRTFNYLDQDGKVQTKTTYTPLAGMMQDTRLIQSFDANKWTNDFTKTIGDRIAPIFGSPELTAGGSYRYTSIIDAGGLPDIKRTIENNIDAFVKNDDNVVRVLSDVFGAAALGDQGHKGYTDQEMLQNQIYGKIKVVGRDGTETEIPRYFDAQGNALEFATTDSGKIVDIFTYELGEDGYEMITDQQREFVGAYLRDRALRAMDIDYNTFTDRPSSRGAGKDPENTAIFNREYYGTEYTQLLYESSALHLNQFPEAKLARNAVNQKNKLWQGTSRNVTVNADLKDILSKTGEEGFHAIGVSDYISESLVENLKLSDVYNHEFNNIDEIIGYENEDGDFRIVIAGRSEIAASATEFEAMVQQQGEEGTMGYELTADQKIIGPGFGFLPRSKYKSLYHQLYENPNFASDMAALGFTGREAVLKSAQKEGQFENALAAYFKARKYGNLPSQTYMQ
jgi:hypothetical protein